MSLLNKLAIFSLYSKLGVIHNKKALYIRAFLFPALWDFNYN